MKTGDGSSAADSRRRFKELIANGPCLVSEQYAEGVRARYRTLRAPLKGQEQQAFGGQWLRGK